MIRISHEHQWASGRVSDDPVVVIDTTRAKDGKWATLPLSSVPEVMAIRPIRSPTWEAALEATEQMTEQVREVLARLRTQS